MVLTWMMFMSFLSASAPAAEAIGKAVVTDLAERQFEKVTSRFTPAMATALPAAKLKEVWDGLKSQIGAFQLIRSVKVERKDEFQVVLLLTAFAKSDLMIRLAIDDAGKVAGLFFLPAGTWSMPAYADATLFEEHDVTIGARVRLPATLTLPKGPGPFPALVLVHGSGPHDRDENLGPNKPFKDVTVGLASRGIATLRYDKRTLVFPALFKGMFTVEEEVLEDARAALEFLGKTAKIDPRRIFLLGHSFGGMLAPRIASQNPGVAGIVVMAGNTRPMEECALDQVRYLAKADRALLASVEETVRRVRSPNLTPGEPVNFLGATIPGSYWLDLRHYHPAEVAASLKIPILILQGQRDYQVTALDFEGWRKALAARGSATLKSYPTLNHLFLSGSGLSKPDEYLQPGHVEEAVILDIASWIRRGNAIQP